MYVLSIDQSTQSTMAAVVGQQGVIATASKLHRQIYERPSWVAQDPEEIFENAVLAVRTAIARSGVSVTNISAIGITNQRETVVFWDRKTGKCLYDAIVWQCRRSEMIIEKLQADGMEAAVRAKTGLLADPYFSASKIRWAIDNITSVSDAMRDCRLMVGTIDTFLVYRLTGRHVTDASNAARTMLFNISDNAWDDELLGYFGIPREILPDVVDSGIKLEDAPVVDVKFFGAAIPICAILGDQSAALFGQGCFTAGSVKNTYGTGCFVLQNTGDKPVFTSAPLLTALAWRIDGKTTYAVEGSIFVAGLLFEWLKNLGLFDSVADIEHILEHCTDSGGVYVVPAFSGLGAPYWDAMARAAIVGVTFKTGRREIVRAACESVVFQCCDILSYIQQATGHAIQTLCVDGGVTKNDAIMQMQADFLGVPIVRPRFTDTTVLGVARLAGIMAGVFKQEYMQNNSPHNTHTFTPNHIPERERIIAEWHKAIESCRMFKL